MFILICNNTNQDEWLLDQKKNQGVIVHAFPYLIELGSKDFKTFLKKKIVHYIAENCNLPRFRCTCV